MMQVTGNNKTNIRGVSIQRDLNGLSFFDTKGKLVAEAINLSDKEEIMPILKKLRKLSSKITIVSATDSYITMPLDLYSADQKELYFASKSLFYDVSMFDYFECRNGRFVLVVAVELELIRIFEEIFSEIIISHSLIKAVEQCYVCKANSISIYQSLNRCAIALVVNSKLLFAEQLVTGNNMDIVYYLKKLINDYADYEFKIHCMGLSLKEERNTLSQFFPNIIII